MATKKYRTLTTEERCLYNLPPSGFQGNEMTVIIQAPTSDAMKDNIEAFRQFAIQRKLDNCEVLMEELDPDGGFRAIVVAHNLNPLTWASEQIHRVGYGIRDSWSQGARQASLQHTETLKSDIDIARAKGREQTARSIRRANKKLKYAKLQTT